jgi:hypothetical protein
MELDRQSIERRDFPIGRRGYDPAAVDAHLRALAGQVEELKRIASGPGADSLAASTGAQVQSIVAAAESAAAEIERQARATADATREQAESDAKQVRADAVAQAQAHVGAVARASSTLLERVESMDGQVSALVESMRAGATRLTGDLAALETNMAELYDAAGARAPEAFPETPALPSDAAPPATPPSPSAASASEATPPPAPPTAPASAPAAPLSPAPAPVAAAPASAAATPGAPENGPAAPVADAQGSAPADSDYDARLVALNMALNGDSREETDRYIAENYQVADRQKLLDEVFAAIEG